MTVLADIKKGAGAALISVLIAFTPAEAKTVGVIMTGDIQYFHDIHAAFLRGLGDSGVEVVLQTPSPEPVSWANAARKLVVIGADVIVAYGAPATLTAMKATSDIPIVFAGVYTPEAMNVTGKNATGISSTVSMDRIVRDLREIKRFSRLGVVFNKSEKDTILQARDITKLEQELGFKTVLLSVIEEIDRGTAQGLDAIILTSSCSGMKCIKNVVGVAREQKMVTGATIGGGEQIGVVLTVVADASEQGTEVARMVRKLLGGARVSDMPVVEPRVIEKVVNVREARTIGLTVPADILKTATKVIQ